MSASRARPSSSSTATCWPLRRAAGHGYAAGHPARQRPGATGRAGTRGRPSVSVSAAKTGRRSAARPSWRPARHGTADEGGERLLPLRGQPGRLPPHRSVTSCMAASQVLDSSGWAHVSITAGHATDKKSWIRCANAVAAVISCARRGPGAAGAPTSHRAPPGYNSAARPPAGRSSRNRTISLMCRIVLLLTGNMRNQRLDAHQRQAPLRAQPLHLHPARPGRLARHRHVREPLRPRLPPPSPAPHPAGTPSPAPSSARSPARHDRSPRSPAYPRPDGSITAPSRGTRPRSRSRRAFRLRSPRVMPLPLPYPQNVLLAAFGHQARTTAPGGRSCSSHIPARQRPLARCPITTPPPSITEDDALARQVTAALTAWRMQPGMPATAGMSSAQIRGRLDAWQPAPDGDRQQTRSANIAFIAAGATAAAGVVLLATVSRAAGIALLATAVALVVLGITLRPKGPSAEAAQRNAQREILRAQLEASQQTEQRAEQDLKKRAGATHLLTEALAACRLRPPPRRPRPPR